MTINTFFLFIFSQLLDQTLINQLLFQLHLRYVLVRMSELLNAKCHPIYSHNLFVAEKVSPWYMNFPMVAEKPRITHNRIIAAPVVKVELSLCFLETCTEKNLQVVYADLLQEILALWLPLTWLLTWTNYAVISRTVTQKTKYPCDIYIPHNPIPAALVIK